MSKYYGLIIPRSYNDYINKSQPQELLQALINTNVVPNTASVTNQLADKEFVNSTVGTNTANYIYKTVEGENVPFDSVEELEAYTGEVTQNDYAFVTGIDENGNRYFDRYKANETDGVITWGKEYRLNNSSFTSEQWAAIESGITAEKLQEYNNVVVQFNNIIDDESIATDKVLSASKTKSLIKEIDDKLYFSVGEKYGGTGSGSTSLYQGAGYSNNCQISFFLNKKIGNLTPRWVNGDTNFIVGNGNRVDCTNYTKTVRKINDYILRLDITGSAPNNMAVVMATNGYFIFE